MSALILQNIEQMLSAYSNICFADEVDWEQPCNFTDAERAEMKSASQINGARACLSNVLRQLRQSPLGKSVIQEMSDTYWCDRDTWVWSQPEFQALLDIDFGPTPYAVHAAEEEWTNRYDEHMAKMAQRWRTSGAEMCRFFQLPSGCRDGENCKYSHEIPDSSSTTVSDIHRDENGDPEICRYFNLPGGCTKEADGGGPCPYRHILGDIEPCRFFNSPTGCRKGASCIFPHIKIVEKDWRSTQTKSLPPKPVSLAAPAINPWRSAGIAMRTATPKHEQEEDGWQIATDRPKCRHSEKLVQTKNGGSVWRGKDRVSGSGGPSGPSGSSGPSGGGKTRSPSGGGGRR